MAGIVTAGQRRGRTLARGRGPSIRGAAGAAPRRAGAGPARARRAGARAPGPARAPTPRARPRGRLAPRLRPLAALLRPVALVGLGGGILLALALGGAVVRVVEAGALEVHGDGVEPPLDRRAALLAGGHGVRGDPLHDLEEVAVLAAVLVDRHRGAAEDSRNARWIPMPPASGPRGG